MHGRLLLLGAACLLTTSAVAADLPIVEPVYVAPLYDWNGFYVGINGGYGGGDFEHPFDVCGYPAEEEEPPPEIAAASFDDEFEGCDNDLISLITGSADITAGGFVGGVQAGYNWQWDPSWLLGIEADIQGSSIDGRLSVSATDEVGIIGSPGDTLDFDIGTSLDWFATIRPRLGWVSDRFVVYGTGGLAWGHTTSSVNASINGEEVLDDIEDFDNESENDRFGWTIGAGVEYAITDNLTFKTEYLYTDLGSAEIIDVGNGFFVAGSDVAFHTVRAGLNFQF